MKVEYKLVKWPCGRYGIRALITTPRGSVFECYFVDMWEDFQGFDPDPQKIGDECKYSLADAVEIMYLLQKDEPHLNTYDYGVEEIEE